MRQLCPCSGGSAARSGGRESVWARQGGTSRLNHAHALHLWKQTLQPSEPVERSEPIEQAKPIHNQWNHRWEATEPVELSRAYTEPVESSDYTTTIVLLFIMKAVGSSKNAQ